jgi:hypothetical protein
MENIENMENMETNVVETTENAETQTAEEMVEETVVEFTDTVEEETQEDDQQEKTQEVEETQEQTSYDNEMLSKEEVNRIVEARLKRERRKQEQELAKYEEVINILKAGLGKEDINEITSTMKEFYREQGIEIPENKSRLEREERILAKADAEEIIEAGEEEMERVANEIAKKPAEKRTLREKIVFEEVCKSLIKTKSAKELAKIGVKPDILDDKEFQEFSKKFNLNTPITEIYELYSKIKNPNNTPKKPIGSVKNTAEKDIIKDFYTPEEVAQFTEEDLRNPKLMEAVENSMAKWKY